MSVRPIPEGYNTVTPYLIVPDAEALIEFVKNAFGSQEKMIMRTPDGSVSHAEMRIGDSLVMIGNAGDRWSPQSAVLHLYVEDCDAVFRKALEAGASSVQEPEDQFYGDRMGAVKDAAGNTWWLATHVEDVSMEEMDKRVAAQAEQNA